MLVAAFFANITLLIRVVQVDKHSITNRALVSVMANKTLEKVEEEYKDQKAGSGDNGTQHGSTGTGGSSTSHKSSKKSKGSSSAGGSTGGSKGGYSN